MSERDCLRYLERPFWLPTKIQDRKLIVITDSKGKNLLDAQDKIGSKCDISQIEHNILIEWAVGRTTEQGAKFIENNLTKYLHRFNKILIAIWTGTCDLTYKNGRYIHLSQTRVEDILRQYHRILSRTEMYKDRVQIVFLECPYYSIRIWNENKGHGNIEEFKNEDASLTFNIDNLNKNIHEINKMQGINAPKFTLDLTHRRKSNKSYTTETIAYSLLRDGIHPDRILSKLWFRRIIDTILIKYCYK